MAKSAKWDTQLGFELYMEGKSDGEIADACRVKTSTITSYRLRHWKVMPGNSPPAETKKNHVIANQSADWCGDPVDRAGQLDEAERKPLGIATSPAAPRNDVEEFDAEEVTEVTKLEMEPVELSDRADPSKALEQKESVRMMMDVIETMTGKMTGLKAVLTGSIIMHLWNWDTRDDLEEAKAVIEYLIDSGCYG